MPLPRRCLQSPQHSGSRMRRVTLALSGPPNLRPELDHRYLIFLLFRQPITSTKLYLPSVRSIVLVKLNCNLFNHHERRFFSASARTSNPQLSLLVGCDSNGRQRNQPCDCAMHDDLSIPRAPENMSHKNIITIYFHIWT